MNVLAPFLILIGMGILYYLYDSTGIFIMVGVGLLYSLLSLMKSKNSSKARDRPIFEFKETFDLVEPAQILSVRRN